MYTVVKFNMQVGRTLFSSIEQHVIILKHGDGHLYTLLELTLVNYFHHQTP